MPTFAQAAEIEQRGLADVVGLEYEIQIKVEREPWRCLAHPVKGTWDKCFPAFASLCMSNPWDSFRMVSATGVVKMRRSVEWFVATGNVELAPE